ncbi:hypothetical protein [Methylicorpusculum sp.]|uniref:hypothetical protein n=1 Tax=Methylicorpusculum sp. TaxID=2713644 RepID=UPI00271BF359|nr:hypothetical protein [Methylicorpusculum sp.]MDO8843837.1 hypothetical protein [Methylicorpusculum sp.]
MLDVEADLKALSDLAEYVLMVWLETETPKCKRRQQALSLLAEAGTLLINAHKMLTIQGK